VATFASDEYPGNLNHYEIVCENHIVDVVGVAVPDIKVLRQPNKRSQPLD